MHGAAGRLLSSLLPRSLTQPRPLCARYLVMASNENASVEKYREHYMKEEDIPGINLSEVSQPQDLLAKIRSLHSEGGKEPLLSRSFVTHKENGGECSSSLNGVGGSTSSSQSIRVMQWNLLAQALSTGKDNFVRCPPEALEWETRSVRILEEILSIEPDIICLQEVDHYGFLAHTLDKVGYEGYFFPKPDSPALHAKDSNGPDGCAMFYRTSHLELTKQDPVVLQRYGETDSLTNQVCIITTFKTKNASKEFLVGTTHLKAKHGWDELRFLQGNWLLDYLERNYAEMPMIVTGDFNADHSELVYHAFQSSKLDLCSTYTLISADSNTEPPYTTFKIRGDAQGGESVSCRTIDYMWHSRGKWQMNKYLSIPTDLEIGPDRLPSHSYPSDHFSLAADYILL